MTDSWEHNCGDIIIRLPWDPVQWIGIGILYSTTHRPAEVGKRPEERASILEGSPFNNNLRDALSDKSRTIEYNGNIRTAESQGNAFEISWSIQSRNTHLLLVAT